jgi:uncharacterized protein YndB with AHSA1/START domain
MRARVFLLIGLTSLAAATSARAEVAQSDPQGFTIAIRRIVLADATQSWDGLVHPARWWNPEHSWSGDAANLGVEARAGGCWCERWNGNEVEHGRIIRSEPGVNLRLRGVFGPLQEQALTGVMDFRLTQGKDGTQIDLSYRVSGPASARLDEVAAIVDQVLSLQMDRFKAHLDPLAPQSQPAPAAD